MTEHLQPTMPSEISPIQPPLKLSSYRTDLKNHGSLLLASDHKRFNITNSRKYDQTATVHSCRKEVSTGNVDLLAQNGHRKKLQEPALNKKLNGSRYSPSKRVKYHVDLTDNDDSIFKSEGFLVSDPICGNSPTSCAPEPWHVLRMSESKYSDLKTQLDKELKTKKPPVASRISLPNVLQNKFNTANSKISEGEKNVVSPRKRGVSDCYVKYLNKPKRARNDLHSLATVCQDNEDSDREQLSASNMSPFKNGHCNAYRETLLDQSAKNLRLKSDKKPLPGLEIPLMRSKTQLHRRFLRNQYYLIRNKKRRKRVHHKKIQNIVETKSHKTQELNRDKLPSSISYRNIKAFTESYEKKYGENASWRIVKCPKSKKTYLVKRFSNVSEGINKSKYAMARQNLGMISNPNRVDNSSIQKPLNNYSWPRQYNKTSNSVHFPPYQPTKPKNKIVCSWKSMFKISQVPYPTNDFSAESFASTAVCYAARSLLAAKLLSSGEKIDKKDVSYSKTHIEIHNDVSLSIDAWVNRIPHDSEADFMFDVKPFPLLSLSHLNFEFHRGEHLVGNNWFHRKLKHFSFVQCCWNNIGKNTNYKPTVDRQMINNGRLPMHSKPFTFSELLDVKSLVNDILDDVSKSDEIFNGLDEVKTVTEDTAKDVVDLSDEIFLILDEIVDMVCVDLDSDTPNTPPQKLCTVAAFSCTSSVKNLLSDLVDVVITNEGQKSTEWEKHEDSLNTNTIFTPLASKQNFAHWSLDDVKVLMFDLVDTVVRSEISIKISDDVKLLINELLNKTESLDQVNAEKQSGAAEKEDRKVITELLMDLLSKIEDQSKVPCLINVKNKPHIETKVTETRIDVADKINENICLSVPVADENALTTSFDDLLEAMNDMDSYFNALGCSKLENDSLHDNVELASLSTTECLSNRVCITPDDVIDDDDDDGFTHSDSIADERKEKPACSDDETIYHLLNSMLLQVCNTVLTERKAAVSFNNTNNQNTMICQSMKLPQPFEYRQPQKENILTSLSVLQNHLEEQANGFDSMKLQMTDDVALSLPSKNFELPYTKETCNDSVIPDDIIHTVEEIVEKVCAMEICENVSCVVNSIIDKVSDKSSISTSNVVIMDTSEEIKRLVGNIVDKVCTSDSFSQLPATENVVENSSILQSDEGNNVDQNIEIAKTVLTDIVDKVCRWDEISTKIMLKHSIANNFTVLKDKNGLYPIKTEITRSINTPLATVTLPAADTCTNNRETGSVFHSTSGDKSSLSPLKSPTKSPKQHIPRHIKHDCVIVLNSLCNEVINLELKEKEIKQKEELILNAKSALDFFFQKDSPKAVKEGLCGSPKSVDDGSTDKPYNRHHLKRNLVSKYDGDYVTENSNNQPKKAKKNNKIKRNYNHEKFWDFYGEYRKTMTAKFLVQQHLYINALNERGLRSIKPAEVDGKPEMNQQGACSFMQSIIKREDQGKTKKKLKKDQNVNKCEFCDKSFEKQSKFFRKQHLKRHKEIQPMYYEVPLSSVKKKKQIKRKLSVTNVANPKIAKSNIGGNKCCSPQSQDDGKTTIVLVGDEKNPQPESKLVYHPLPAKPKPPPVPNKDISANQIKNRAKISMGHRKQTARKSVKNAALSKEEFIAAINRTSRPSLLK